MQYKDKQIKKLEDDLVNLLNDYNELEASINNSTREEDIKTRNYEEEIRTLQDEKNILYKDNISLQIKAQKLENIESDLRMKYVLKSEFDRKIKQIELDRDNYKNSLDEIIQQLNIEKREKCNLKIQNAELLKSIQEQGKQFQSYYDSVCINEKDEEDEEPQNLNMLMSSNSEDTQLNVRTYQKIKQQTIKTPDDYELNSAEENILSKLIKEEDFKKVSIKITPIDMNKVYREARTMNDGRLSRRFCEQPRASERRSYRPSMQTNNKEEIYREFFKLTYQAFKLNCENVEPFLCVIFFKLA
jgi:hypothetical protein